MLGCWLGLEHIYTPARARDAAGAAAPASAPAALQPSIACRHGSGRRACPDLTRRSSSAGPGAERVAVSRHEAVALTGCACVSAPKGANRGADKSALDATRSRAGMRCVGHCLTVLAHPRARATVDGAQRLSSRSSTRVESGLGVGSCPRLALRAAWSPSSSPSCALRADRARAAGATPHASQFCSREPPPPPLACPPRGAPPGLARPRPRRARVPTPAPRPRQIGSRGRRRGCSSARTSPPTGREEYSEL